MADHRPAWATPARFPTVDQVLVCTPKELVKHAPFRPGSHAVIMSHHFERDRELLSLLLADSAIDYVGLLGSRKRSQALIAEVLTEIPQLAAAASIKLRAPVGLDLGADGPEQIAVAIVAQLLAERNGRPGEPLCATRNLLPQLNLTCTM